MDNIKKLRQDRADALKAAQALQALSATQAEGMTAEQGTQFDGFMATVANCDTNIKRAEALLDAERTAPAVQVEVGKDLAEKKPWKNLGEQLMAVKDFGQSRGHKRDPRLFATATGQNETIDAEGGFLVQPEVAPDFITRMFQDDEIVKRCRTRPVGSSRLVINGMDDANRVGGPAGMGVLVQRVAEADPGQFSKLKYRRIELVMNKLMAFYKATDELLEDAPALQAEINDYVPSGFSWKMGSEVLNGTGAGQFLGINTSNATVVVAKETGQAAGTITVPNLLKMKSRLWFRSRPTAVWLSGPDVEAVLETLTLPGATGTSPAIYTPAGMGTNNTKYGLLLGMPVIPVEQTAPLGTQGDLMLVDLQQYMIGERNGIQVASSIHVAFLTDEQVFRWTLRNDGAPLWDKPVTQNNSSNTVSPFVTLASRF